VRRRIKPLADRQSPNIFRRFAMAIQLTTLVIIFALFCLTLIAVIAIYFGYPEIAKQVVKGIPEVVNRHEEDEHEA
jgi:hypothetical protein